MSNSSLMNTTGLDGAAKLGETPPPIAVHVGDGHTDTGVIVDSSSAVLVVEEDLKMVVGNGLNSKYSLESNTHSSKARSNGIGHREPMIERPHEKKAKIIGTPLREQSKTSKKSEDVINWQSICTLMA